MKIAVWADMEGASGVDDPWQCATSLPEFYQRGREFTTGDVNAAIRGLREVGSLEIDVWDGHGSGGHIMNERLEPDVNYVGGGWKLFEMINNGILRGHYDGWIMLGMHAMAGTRNGFMSHTNNLSMAMRINDQWVGELSQITWLLGQHDIPVIMVAGDDAFCREADHFTPDALRVKVKHSRAAQILNACLWTKPERQYTQRPKRPWKAWMASNPCCPSLLTRWTPSSATRQEPIGPR